MAQIIDNFLGYCEKHYFVRKKLLVLLFGHCFKNLGTFFSNIWSHCAQQSRAFDLKWRCNRETNLKWFDINFISSRCLHLKRSPAGVCHIYVKRYYAATSVTRWWDIKCGPLFPKVTPKVATAYFALKVGFFKIANHVVKYLGIFCLKNRFQDLRIKPKQVTLAATDSVP